jgi:hypothetical protein
VGITDIDFEVTSTNIVSSNPVHGELYSIKHYVIKFVSDLRQVGGFLRVLRFPPKKTDHQYITEILLKVTINTIKPNQTIYQRNNIRVNTIS